MGYRDSKGIVNVVVGQKFYIHSMIIFNFKQTKLFNVTKHDMFLFKCCDF